MIDIFQTTFFKCISLKENHGVLIVISPQTSLKTFSPNQWQTFIPINDAPVDSRICVTKRYWRFQ